MNNIQNYNYSNYNYGKINKSPNFKAWHVSEKYLKELAAKGDYATNLATNTKMIVEGFENSLEIINLNLNHYIEELQNALNFKKVAENTKIFDGIITDDGTLGIKHNQFDDIFVAPFTLNGHTINGTLLGTENSSPIIDLTATEAAKLTKDLPITDVLQACENSVKEKLNQIYNLARNVLE